MRRGPVTRQQELGLDGLMRCCPPAAALCFGRPRGCGQAGTCAAVARVVHPAARGHASMVFLESAFDDDMTGAGATCAEQQPQVDSEVLNRCCAGAGMPAGKRIEIIILSSIMASGEHSLCHLFFGNSPWTTGCGHMRPYCGSPDAAMPA